MTRAVALEAEVEAERAKVRSLVTTLEGIAHFGIGAAGVVARDALVELGVWSDTVERDPAPPPVTLCLETLAARGVGLRHAVHDPPMFEHMGEALMDGTWVFVVPVTVDDVPAGMTRLGHDGGSDLFDGTPP